MSVSLTQHARAVYPIGPQERLERLGACTPEQITAGLIWLSGYDPGTFDAVLEAIETRSGDPDANDEPAPYCALCGASIGIFLRFGLDWRHYREAAPPGTRAAGPGSRLSPGEGAAFGRIELFDPGHTPVAAWRYPGDDPLADMHAPRSCGS